MYESIHACERKLDELDQEFDENVGPIISRLQAEQVRELLACVKCMVDLERIGDLISGFASRAKIVGARMSPQDSYDLIKMASALEQMISDAHYAFFHRDLDRAVRVLRADAEIDRIRNLIHIRHLENHEGIAGPESINVIFMAQAIERAGDHAKNIAEEACHLISGHSIRHLSEQNPKSREQVFMEYLRKQPGFRR